jgi:hypothetical protein
MQPHILELLAKGLQGVEDQSSGCESQLQGAGWHFRPCHWTEMRRREATKYAPLSAPAAELLLVLNLTTVVGHHLCHLQGLELALVEEHSLNKSIFCIGLAYKRQCIHVPTVLISEYDCILFTM